MARLRFVLTFVVAFALAGSGAALATQQKPAPPPPQKPGAAGPAPVLVLDTDKGVIEIELSPADAPKAVARLVELAKQGFYRGQRFHWATKGVAQFGDPQSRDMTKETQWGMGGSGPRGSVRPIGVAEISKQPFVRGSVGLAYRPNVQTAEDSDSQMFILTLANPPLNGKYIYVGHVTKGLAVAEKIEKGDTIKMLTVK